MASIKVASLDQFAHKIPSRRKVFPGFGLGICALFIVYSLVFFSNSSTNHLFRPMFQGFYNSVPNSSIVVSWPFSLPNTALSSLSSSSSGNESVQSSDATTSEVYKPGIVKEGVEEGIFVGKIPEANVSTSDENAKTLDNDRQGKVNHSAHLGKFSGVLKTGVDGNWVEDKTHVGETDKNAKLSCSNGNGTVLEKAYNVEVENVSFHAEIGEASFLKKTENLSADDPKEKLFKGKIIGGKSAVTGRNGGNSSDWKVGDIDKGKGLRHSMVTAERDHKLSDGCDYFNGGWVRDDTKSYYPPGSCPYIDRDFNCQHNGRPDDGYLRWKWQPYGCHIPSLNATDFLERLRGKKLVFVGDSLNRNMWESLVCILHHSIENKHRVYEISGRTEFKKKGFYAFRFEDYNCSVDFVSAPFLVRESLFERTNKTLETLRLDLMDRTTSMYHDADIIIFNTGHWWTHEKTSRGEDYYQEGDYVHPRLKVLEAYKKALITWARWVDQNIDGKRTRVFFRGYSVTHFRGGQWNSGGQCHKETEPIFNQSYLGSYPSKMRALEHVLKEMKTPVVYLNISRLTDHRKDGHPSIFRKVYQTAEERATAEQFQDCSHWCLPGVPDAWNELLYASLLKAEKGWRGV
ncbi:hypothetical protein Ancab_020469 [Ancistrocladus abbreviatus]